MTHRTLAIVFAISLIVLVAVTAAYFISTQPSEVGDVQAVEASLGRPPPVTVPVSTTTLPTQQPPSPLVPVRSGLLSEELPLAETVPVGLRVPTIEVDAPIIPAGVDTRTGQMAVPGNVRDVAWYEYGSRPGEAGSAVLAAHVDLASQGRGVFFRLRELEPGEVVEVEFSDGSVASFRVEARTIYQKDELPLGDIFATQGAPVLTLVTCGGGFSESLGSYDSNVVVYAVPVAVGDSGPAQ